MAKSYEDLIVLIHEGANVACLERADFDGLVKSGALSAAFGAAAAVAEKKVEAMQTPNWFDKFTASFAGQIWENEATADVSIPHVGMQVKFIRKF